MKNTSLPTTVLLVSLLGGATSAAAQVPVTVMRLDDFTTGIGVVESFVDFRINDHGDWVLKAVTDHPNPDRDVVLVRNGELMVREGDPAPGLTGATFSQFGDFDVNDGGRFALCSTVDLPAGETSVLYYGGQPLVVEGDLVGSGGFAAGSTYLHFHLVDLNDSNHLLVFAVVLEGTSFVDALLRFKVDAMGNLTNEVLLRREDGVPPGQGYPIIALWGSPNAYCLNDNGGGVWSAILDSGASPHADVTYFNSTLVAQSATPSPVPGRDWANQLGPLPSDTNSSGSWVIRSMLDSTNTTNDELILRDGAVYRREGGPLPAFPGSDVVDLGDGPVSLTQSGEVVYYCRFDGVPAGANEGLFVGNDVVARKGVTHTFDGQLLTEVHDDFAASDDGNFLLCRAVLDGSDEALLIVERKLGADYCSAETNSTGGTSFIVAAGSTFVGFNSLRLRTFGMPANQFGYYLTSMTQANILHPGGSQGRLCLGGPIGRFTSQVQSSGPLGKFAIDVDLTAIPMTPAVAVLPGETWNYQTWHRDNNPSSTSNFSLPVSITFR